MLQTQVAAATFSAFEYMVETEAAEVLSAFSPAEEQRIDRIEQQLAACVPINPNDPARSVMQDNIVNSYFAQTSVQASTPPAGSAPLLTLLGGRGGSGKSWFRGKTYNPNNAIIIDADDVKQQIPEFQGWNAGQVHEESNALVDRILTDARDLGLNVVLDATMKTTLNTLRLMQGFIDVGYEVAAFYMFLPRQKAAHRAVQRFLGGGAVGRYVPVVVVLSNAQNERTFDSVRQHAQEWAFFDNDVALGAAPIIIARHP